MLDFCLIDPTYWHCIYAHEYQIKHLGRTYCEEQKWIRKRELPKFKDYMRHAQITTFIHVTFISVIPSLKSTTKETIQWLLSNSPMVQSVGVTARIVNDLGTYRVSIMHVSISELWNMPENSEFSMFLLDIKIQKVNRE